MSVGGGAQLGDAPIALNAASLKGFDLVILDERAWSSLGEGQRAALNEAIRGGLGVLLRVTGALSESEQRRLRALGFTVDAGRDAAEIHLLEPRRDDDALRARIGPGTRDQARSHEAPVPETPALTRRSLRIAANDGIALLRDQSEQPLALWRAERSWPHRRLAAHRYVSPHPRWPRRSACRNVESRSRNARARADRCIRSPSRASRASANASHCAASRAPRVSHRQRERRPRCRIDPATRRACAAYWPRESGWHQLYDAGPHAALPRHGRERIPRPPREHRARSHASPRRRFLAAMRRRTLVGATGSAPPR